MHFILRGRRKGTNGTFHRNKLGYSGTFDYATSNANLVPSHFQIRSLTVCSVNETGVFKCHKVTRTGKGMREGVPSNFHLGSLFHNSLVILPHQTTSFVRKKELRPYVVENCVSPSTIIIIIIIIIKTMMMMMMMIMIIIIPQNTRPIMLW